MTRGSNTPLVPPLEDHESAIHKKKEKSVKEDQTPKKTPLQELKSAFSRKSRKKTEESVSSSKNKIKLEHLDQIPVQAESEYDTEPEFELHVSEPENELENEMENID